jgi:hypothetical protein
VPVEQLRADQLCPSIVVRPGTETLRLYAGEEETPSNVRYQSQILQTVVECTPGSGQFGLSIGIAGRSIIGPQGVPATLDLPIRIVVLNTVTSEILSSEVVRTQAIIEPPEVSATFTLVNRAFFVPQPAAPERLSGDCWVRRGRQLIGLALQDKLVLRSRLRALRLPKPRAPGWFRQDRHDG